MPTSTSHSCLSLHPDPGAETVPCRRLAAWLPLRTCLLRHAARWPSGRRKGAPRFVPCGRWELGALRLFGAGGWFVKPPDSQPPEVLTPDQRHAKRRNLEVLAEGEDGGPDPFQVVAMMTPDDRD